MTEPLIRETDSVEPSEFCELYHVCFGKNVGIDYFEWKFRANPAGDTLHVVAESEGKMIGLVNFMPSRIRVGGVDARACQAADAMVHPQFRRRGLLTNMTRLANAKMEERSWSFVVNFTGEVLFSAYLRLGHYHLFDLEHRIAPSMRGLFQRLANKIGGVQRIQPQDVSESFDERFDQLWQRTADLHDVAQRRDLAYLRWRYEHRPDSKYRVVTSDEKGILRGFAITRGPYIVDLWTDGDSHVISSLARKAIRVIQDQGEALVTFASSPQAIEPFALKRAGLREYRRNWRPRPILPRQPMTILCPDEALRSRLISSRWYVTMGDSDWL